jgi:hypothetical protein
MASIVKQFSLWRSLRIYFISVGVWFLLYLTTLYVGMGGNLLPRNPQEIVINTFIKISQDTVFIS